jgi:hypothetical protein
MRISLITFYLFIILFYFKLCQSVTILQKISSVLIGIALKDAEVKKQNLSSKKIDNNKDLYFLSYPHMSVIKLLSVFVRGCFTANGNFFSSKEDIDDKKEKRNNSDELIEFDLDENKVDEDECDCDDLMNFLSSSSSSSTTFSSVISSLPSCDLFCVSAYFDDMLSLVKSGICKPLGISFFVFEILLLDEMVRRAAFIERVYTKSSKNMGKISDLSKYNYKSLLYTMKSSSDNIFLSHSSSIEYPPFPFKKGKNDAFFDKLSELAQKLYEDILMYNNVLGTLIISKKSANKPKIPSFDIFSSSVTAVVAHLFIPFLSSSLNRLGTLLSDFTYYFVKSNGFFFFFFLFIIN